MNRRHILISVLLALVALAIGFVIGSNYREQPVAALPVEEATYAMNVVVSGVPFWLDTRAAWTEIDRATKEVEVLFGGPTDTDAQKQIDEVQALLAKGIDGLIIAPADSAALAPVIDKAVGQGVDVITYLVDSPSSKRLTYVASELETAAQRIGKLVTAEGRGSSGKALVMYAQAGNAEQEARRQGFEQLIKSTPGLQLATVIQDNYDENKGAELVKAALVADRDIKYIFGANSRSAVGAVSALRELGYRPGEVVVSGWDTDTDVLDLIRAGWVKGSVAQQSAFMTQLMFGILEANRRGYLYPAERSYKERGVRPVPENIIVPVALVTPENVSAFYPKNK